MRSRFTSLALTVLGVVLALAVGATPAAAWSLLELNVIGEGAVLAGQSSCWDTAFQPGCTMTATGIAFDATGTAFGSGTFSVELKTSPGPAEPNADGGLCLTANRSAQVGLSSREQYVTLTNADGDSLALNTIGTLCEESGPATSYHYNGTYRIEGNRSTGRFADAVGGGAFNLTFYRIAPGTTTLQLHGTIR